MTTNNYFAKYISTSSQKDLLDSSSEQTYIRAQIPTGPVVRDHSNCQQNSRTLLSSGPVVRDHSNCQVSGPAELSFALVHGTTNCHEKCKAFSHLTLSAGPTPLGSSLSEGQWLLMRSTHTHRSPSPLAHSFWRTCENCGPVKLLIHWPLGPVKGFRKLLALYLYIYIYSAVSLGTPENSAIQKLSIIIIIFQCWGHSWQLANVFH